MKKNDNKQDVEDVEGVLPNTTSLLSFHERFDFLIRRFYMTQQEVAERLEIVQSHVSGLRAGRTKPSQKIISRIAAEFGCNVEWLHFGTGPQFPAPAEQEKLPKEYKGMFDEFIEIYDRLETDKEKFEFQGETYNFFKNFKQMLNDRKK